MPAFRFRAAAALDLRIRRETAAKRAVADAQGALERAEAGLLAARGEFDAGVAKGASAAHDPGLSIWYRNWINRQHQELARRHAMVVDRRAAVEGARSRLHLAHRDVRVLERLRDRLHAAWTLSERRLEQKELDWLGSIRHALAANPNEEVT